MKKLISTLLAVCLFAFVSLATVKVACVGDSITYGSGIKDRAKDSYPAQLGKLLGADYEVANFGVGGATLLSKGNKPYIETYAYLPALKFEPNIVVIKLGTNDSKPFNWIYKEDFESDLISLINSFASLPTKPVIFLCRQAPAIEDRWGITESVIAGEVFPKVQKVAKERGLTVIDMHKILEGKPDLFSDKIHPNPEGAKLMAQEVQKAIKSLNLNPKK